MNNEKHFQNFIVVRTLVGNDNKAWLVVEDIPGIVNADISQALSKLDDNEKDIVLLGGVELSIVLYHPDTIIRLATALKEDQLKNS